MAIKLVQAVGAIHERSARDIVTMSQLSCERLIIHVSELNNCRFKDDENAMKAIREEANEGPFSHLVIFYIEE